MEFKVTELKNILSYIRNNNINIAKITSHNFELIINKKLKMNTGKKTSLISNINNKKLKGKDINTISINKTPIVNHEIDSYSTIISPMVGTFYRSPAPNEPAFVKEYDTVKKKQTVCIIEAMKLMNEIEAEVDGEIVEILVKDGEIVDCGQALMKVKT